MSTADPSTSYVNADLLPGTPRWVDVASSDPPATMAFYSGLLGWEFDPRPDTTPDDYTFALLDGQPVAGLRHLHNGSGPNAWNIYLSVADLDGTARQASALGGKILTDPLDIRGHGSMCMITDPTGGRVGLWEPFDDWESTVGVPGALCWAELNTRNGRIADKFFAGLFGYRQMQTGDGRYVDHTVWTLGGENVLGRNRVGDEWPPNTPSQWMLYFGVYPSVGITIATRQVARLGGRVLVRPYEAAYGRVAIIQDPTGAMFSLIEPILDDEDDTSDPWDD